MTPSEFWDACNQFDWFFDYSDDGRMRRAAEVRAAQILREASPGSENRKMWDAFKAHYFSGESFGTPKQPKPERPVT